MEIQNKNTEERLSDDITSKSDAGMQTGTRNDGKNPGPVNNAGGNSNPTPEKPRIHEPRYYVWLDMLALIGVFIVANLVGAFLKVIVTKWAGSDPGFGTFVAYMTTFFITIGFALWQQTWRGSSEKSSDIAAAHGKKEKNGLIPLWTIWGIVLVIATSVVIEPIVNIFPSENLDLISNAIGTGGWAILTSVVAAPICEELLFRGIVQKSLMKNIGQFRGIIAASAIFGLVHFIPQQIVNAFFIGLILGFIYARTKSLIPVILIHAFNNALAFIQMSLGSGEYMTTRELIGNDTMYWIVYGFCCALLIFMVAALAFTQQLAAASDLQMNEQKKKNTETK